MNIIEQLAERSRQAKEIAASASVEEIEAMHAMATSQNVAALFRAAILVKVPDSLQGKAYQRMFALDRNRFQL